jgi:twinkle protein
VKTGTYPVPTLYDISGSAHFRNKADMGLSVWRDVLDETGPTHVYVQKARFRWCGKPGMVELYFNVTNGQFSETRPEFFKEYVEADTW